MTDDEFRTLLADFWQQGSLEMRDRRRSARGAGLPQRLVRLRLASVSKKLGLVRARGRPEEMAEMLNTPL